MVTINFTLVIELGLFLLFLWGTQRYILGPVLKSVDEREEGVEQDTADAEAGNVEADALEIKYRHDIAVIRRQADAEVHAARTKSQNEHARFLSDERTRADESILEARRDAEQLVEEQREEMLAQVPDLVVRIEENLTSWRNR
jgi:F-type H+-transporting ATPase subunit b